ncbi:hypothetical protein C0993_005117 [Termitomyces sp. T159_Od127]|nr:hypothetical protein C0993_005117 [Termitomyces sp. T159_Od127]
MARNNETRRIPRPPNAFILYRSYMTGKLPPPSPGTYRKQGDISRMISELWRNESKEVKAQYQQLALTKKLEHEVKYPGYKYSPRSKEQRERERRARLNETNSSTFELTPTAWSQQDIEEVFKALHGNTGGSNYHIHPETHAACYGLDVQFANAFSHTNQNASSQWQAYGDYIPSTYEASLDSMLQELTEGQINHSHSGEVVVDFGSGGGIDVLLAAVKVGPHGQAIGIDVSAYYADESAQDMIALARQNANEKCLKPPQVAFVQASLAEPLPISPNTVDCVLSNCVINLLPHDKKEVTLKEAHRILKPGGRLVLDDVRYVFFIMHD